MSQDYADKVLRLTVRLEQLSKAATTDVQKVLRKMQAELMLAFLRDPINSRKVIARVRKLVKKISIARYAEINRILYTHESASAAAAHAAEIVGFATLGEVASGAVKKLDVEKIVAAAMDIVMPGTSGGVQITVGQFVERYTASGMNSVLNIAERAYTEGLPVSTIAELIRGTVQTSARGSESLARTVIQATANEARDTVASGLPVEKELWLATLDSSTCAYCRGLDGTCRPKGKFPRLAHPQCRCVRLYIPDDMSCAEMKAGLSRVTRGADGKSTPSNKYQDYGTWIQTQPMEFQQDVLGKKRAKMLESGEITFRKMYTAAGRQKTVEEITAHYS